MPSEIFSMFLITQIMIVFRLALGMIERYVEQKTIKIDYAKELIDSRTKIRLAEIAKMEIIE